MTETFVDLNVLARQKEAVAELAFRCRPGPRRLVAEGLGHALERAELAIRSGKGIPLAAKHEPINGPGGTWRVWPTYHGGRPCVVLEWPSSIAEAPSHPNTMFRDWLFQQAFMLGLIPPDTTISSRLVVYLDR